MYVGWLAGTLAGWLYVLIVCMFIYVGMYVCVWMSVCMCVCMFGVYVCSGKCMICVCRRMNVCMGMYVRPYVLYICMHQLFFIYFMHV